MELLLNFVMSHIGNNIELFSKWDITIFRSNFSHIIAMDIRSQYQPIWVMFSPLFTTNISLLLRVGDGLRE